MTNIFHGVAISTEIVWQGEKRDDPYHAWNGQPLQPGARIQHSPCSSVTWRAKKARNTSLNVWQTCALDYMEPGICCKTSQFENKLTTISGNIPHMDVVHRDDLGNLLEDISGKQVCMHECRLGCHALLDITGILQIHGIFTPSTTENISRNNVGNPRRPYVFFGMRRSESYTFRKSSHRNA